MPLLAVQRPILYMLEFTTRRLLYQAFLLGTALATAGDVDALSQCMTCVTIHDLCHNSCHDASCKVFSLTGSCADEPSGQSALAKYSDDI